MKSSSDESCLVLAMKVGVLSVQGAVSEHVDMINQVFHESAEKGSVIVVRRRDQMQEVDSLIIPGGESTAISKLISRQGLRDVILQRAEEGMPIMGTCAGCILLAKAEDDEVLGTERLSLMDMKVIRNAFGRQRESFEADVDISVLDGSFPAVFIRAPAILETSGDCEELARLGKYIVMAKQENSLAVAFHPELSGDSRIHRFFLDL